MISRRFPGGPSGRYSPPGRSGAGRFSPGRPMSDDQEEGAGIERRLPKSPIYEGGGPFAGTMPRAQPPKLLRDCLYDRMCDWRGHTIAEMELWLPGNKWVLAMIDLIAFGFAFDRSVQRDGTKTLCLRKREHYERKQQVVDILSGITLPDRIVLSPDSVSGDSQSAELSTRVVVPQESTVLADQGSWMAPPDVERMAIDVSGDIVLSAPDLVAETVGILARKGAGKTYLAMVIAEEFLASTFDIPFVVLDPMGVWWGLLADVDGKPNENRLAVFGGEHGHYSLGSGEGMIMARMVVAARPMPFIFDLSLFPSEEQHRFCADFAAELFLRNRDPLHLFIDEADGFAPQRLEGKSSRYQKRSLNEIDRLVRRGRTHGLGVTMITQRPAVISKNVLTQVGVMFFLETEAPHDLKAIEEWLYEQIPFEVRRQCLEELPVLGKGQTFYLRGGEHYRFCKFTVRMKTTFDSSFTPSIREKRKTAEVCQLSDEDRGLLDKVLLVARSGATTSGAGVEGAGALDEVEKLAMQDPGAGSDDLGDEDSGDEEGSPTDEGCLSVGEDPSDEDSSDARKLLTEESDEPVGETDLALGDRCDGDK